MKKSVFIEHIIEAAAQEKKDITEIFLTVKEIGYEGVVVKYDVLNTPLYKKIKNANLKIASVVRYMSFERDFTKSELEGFVKDVKNAGCKNTMIVPEYAKKAERKADLSAMFLNLNNLCEVAEKHQITVSVEDYDSENMPCCNFETLKLFFNNVPKLKFTLDTGNFAYFDEDVLKVLKEFSGRISDVHAKDRCVLPKTLGDEPTVSISGKMLYPCYVGGGEMPLKQVFKALKEINYCGFVSSEHFGAKCQLDYILKSAKGLDSLMN